MPINIPNNLPELNPATKNRLIMIADQYASTHKEKVLYYLVHKQITIDEMPLLDNVPDIKLWLIEQMEEFLHQPDPAEQQDRNQLLRIMPASPDAVKHLDESSLRSLKQQLENYIGKYEATSPQGNIVSNAKDYLKNIALIEEEHEWKLVDIFNYNALIEYLRKHPNTPFFSELDNAVWDIVSYEKDNMAMIKQFINDMPRSRHLSEAKNIESEYSDWQRVKKERRLESVYNYWNRHYTGVFGNEADDLLKELKKERLLEIKETMNNKSYQDYENIINQGIITKDDMIAAGIITEESIERLRNIKQNDRVIDLGKALCESPIGCTDVYFFGVPSAGKSCVIMGLLNSPNFEWSYVTYGGEYGEKLMTLCANGTTPGQTRGDFTTLINGYINDQEDANIKHHVNIIDIAGEGFANKIARNKEAKVTFKDIDAALPKLLLNDNEKVFFIIVDPRKGAEKSFIRKVEEDGSTTISEINQAHTLSRFLDLLVDIKDNNKILDKIKAIHVVATKSDCLSNDKDEAFDIVKSTINMNNSYQKVSNKIKKICEANDLNIMFDNKPQLYTFSLGTFYYGGIFEYDSTDSDYLLDGIASMSSGRRNKKWYEKIKDWFNSKMLS